MSITQPTYKKTFEATTTFEEMELSIAGGQFPASQMSVLEAPSEMQTMAKELNERLHKEIDAFEKEEGDITIVKREPRLFLTSSLDDSSAWQPALCLEVEVTFTHEDDDV